MKKKILLTLLLALVVVAAQAQQRSGLNLCLRDETTGEWLIGLFDEYAIYDCDYWSYAEVGKGRLVLTHDKQHKEIRLKKGSVAIDGGEAQDIGADHPVPARLSRGRRHAL